MSMLDTLLCRWLSRWLWRWLSRWLSKWLCRWLLSQWLYENHLISCAKNVVDDLAGVRFEVTSCKFLTREKNILNVKNIWHLIINICMCLLHVSKHILHAKLVTAALNKKSNSDKLKSKVRPKRVTNIVKNLFWIIPELSYHFLRHV